MPRFVAFLRGINVGGRSVKKEQLWDTFVSLGFESVATFKQSGNVIFETSSTDAGEVKAKIEQKLKITLGYEVAVFIRTIEHLRAIVALDTFKGQATEGTSFLVTLLPTSLQTFPLQLPLTIPKSTAQIIAHKGTEVFSVTHGGGEGGLPNPFIESKLKVKTTSRNINIIQAIAEKYSED
jgi:uncharacterized protein (DUF1697 family)